MQPVPVCTFPPFHSSAWLSSPGKAISSRALIHFRSWGGKHIENRSAEHPSQKTHPLCLDTDCPTARTQECSVSHCFNIITFASFAVTPISFAGVCNEYKLMSTFKHLDADMNFSILPSQIGSFVERASCFLSNKTVNKDILGLLSCILLHEHNLTCWFIQTQLQAGQHVSFPCHLSPVVSYFWQSGTQMIQGKTRCLQSLLWLRPLIYSLLSAPNWEEILLQKSRFSAMKWEKQHLRLDLIETWQ